MLKKLSRKVARVPLPLPVRVPSSVPILPFAKKKKTAKYKTNLNSAAPNTAAPHRVHFETKLQRLIKEREYDKVLTMYVQTEAMNKLQDTAYKAKKGYAIGKVQDERILFVSGSRNLVDWTFNVADDFIPSSLQVVSNHTAKNLTKIFHGNAIDVAVGHSRGGALVAKMDIPVEKKLGVDAAMRLAPKNRRDMMNLYQNNLLDKYISRKGTNQKKYKVNKFGNYHFLSRDSKGQMIAGY